MRITLMDQTVWYTHSASLREKQGRARGGCGGVTPKGSRGDM